MLPPSGTLERWAWDYVSTTSLAHKLAPPPVPAAFEPSPPPRRITAPGRPPELVVGVRAVRTRGAGSPEARARALHTFFHHELQAAELMLWALLAFPETPREMKQGLVRIALDEVRHMGLYAGALERLGHRIGDFPVRDWFWARVPACESPASFLAVMGLGLESANLERGAAWAARFRAAGDEAGARVQEQVVREELAHVRFGVKWFAHFTGGVDFEAWRRALPAPLTPLLLRGQPLDRAARARAGQPEAFVDALAAWEP
jgi:uncharacterized ferritin-like protein (DUF455 family)